EDRRRRGAVQAAGEQPGPGTGPRVRLRLPARASHRGEPVTRRGDHRHAEGPPVHRRRSQGETARLRRPALAAGDCCEARGEQRKAARHGRPERRHEGPAVPGRTTRRREQIRPGRTRDEGDSRRRAAGRWSWPRGRCGSSCRGRPCAGRDLRGCRWRGRATAGKGRRQGCRLKDRSVDVVWIRPWIVQGHPAAGHRRGDADERPASTPAAPSRLDLRRRPGSGGDQMSARNWLKSEPRKPPKDPKHVDLVHLIAAGNTMKARGEPVPHIEYIKQFGPKVKTDEWGDPLPLSSVAQYDLDRLVAIMLDPLDRARDLLMSGMLNPDEVTALKAVYPTVWAALVDASYQDMIETKPPWKTWAQNVLGVLFQK